MSGKLQSKTAQRRLAQVQQEEFSRQCLNCRTEKKASGYYVSTHEYFNGYTPICKACIGVMVDPHDILSVVKMLQFLDIPFLKDTWDEHYTKAVQESRGVAGRAFRNPIGTYMNAVSHDVRNKSLDRKGFLDGDYQYLQHPDLAEEFEAKEAEDFHKAVEQTTNENTPFGYEPTFEDYELWGTGHTNEMYYYYNRKYNALEYTQKTPMHTELFLNYIKYQVRAEMEMNQGALVKDVKAWHDLAMKQAVEAKFTPKSQGKEEDDSIDSFALYTQLAEENHGIIKALPIYHEAPKDKIDFIIWQYINYGRHLEGKPLVTYSEVYQFIEEQTKEFEKAAKSEGKDFADNLLELDEIDSLGDSNEEEYD